MIVPAPQAADRQAPRLLDQVRNALRVRHLSRRTEKAYVGWIRRYILFHGKRHPRDLEGGAIGDFLSHLAVSRKVSASTQNQALSALLFLYREVLGIEVGELEGVVRARRPSRLPVVLSRREVEAVLSQMEGTHRLIAGLLYGTGLRLTECLSLRIKDLDFEYRQITIREAKGGKDRVTVLPKRLVSSINRQLRRVKTLHLADLRDGVAGATMSESLARKYPAAPTDWGWQYLLPSQRLVADHNTGELRRHHLHDTSVRRAVKAAARSAGLTKRVSCHTFRHSFATHLLEQGYDIRTVQELLGHKSVSTTMIYTHVLNCGGLAIASPIDTLSALPETQASKRRGIR